MNSTLGNTVVVGDRQNLDPNILAALGDVTEVLEVTFYRESDWAKAFRLSVLQKSGGKERYFMKVSVGHHGKLALKGEFASTSAIHAIVPDACPKPIVWGTFESDPNSHFYICKFYDLIEGPPEPRSFCETIARLHSTGSSPEGKFGFHCTTYNGNLPQDNAWCDSWEEFFAKGLRHIFNVREERAGPSPDLEAFLPQLFDKVIPRLLRPLESGGRKIKPSLVHGDLWYGNTGTVDDHTKMGIIYDPASFWAHNEYELGNWRPGRNRFTHEYFEAYHSLIPEAEPKVDHDDRIALYALRFDLQAAALYPKQELFLQEAIEGIKRLCKKYPEGYTE